MEDLIFWEYFWFVVVLFFKVIRVDFVCIVVFKVVVWDVFCVVVVSLEICNLFYIENCFCYIFWEVGIFVCFIDVGSNII